MYLDFTFLFISVKYDYNFFWAGIRKTGLVRSSVKVSEFDMKASEFVKTVLEFDKKSPEEGRSAHQSKRCVYNNKDDQNILNTLNDINHQSSSKKFTQFIYVYISLFLLICLRVRVDGSVSVCVVRSLPIAMSVIVIVSWVRGNTKIELATHVELLIVLFSSFS